MLMLTARSSYKKGVSEFTNMSRKKKVFKRKVLRFLSFHTSESVL